MDQKKQQRKKNPKDLGGKENPEEVGRTKNPKEVGKKKNAKEVDGKKNPKKVGEKKNPKEVGGIKNPKESNGKKNPKEVGDKKKATAIPPAINKPEVDETTSKTMSGSNQTKKRATKDLEVEKPKANPPRQHKKGIQRRTANNTFPQELDEPTVEQLFQFLEKYRPEVPITHSERLEAMQEADAAGKFYDFSARKPKLMFNGVRIVGRLVSEKKVQLVIIAHDYHPVRLLAHLPILCRQNEIPCCVVKDSSRMGEFMHQSYAVCLALKQVDNADRAKFATLLKKFPPYPMDIKIGKHEAKKKGKKG